MQLQIGTQVRFVIEILNLLVKLAGVGKLFSREFGTAESLISIGFQSNSGMSLLHSTDDDNRQEHHADDLPPAQ